MDYLITLFFKTLLQVWTTFTHNWPFLLVSILIAVAMKLYIDTNKVSAFLIRHRQAGVIGAVIAAVTTPLCSCGTTAIVLAMMAGTMPWAPIVAFMVSSPLTSPEGLVYSAGLFGWPFAIAFYIASILLGLLGGAAAGFVESRGWLTNQARVVITGQAVRNSDVAHSLTPQASRIPATVVQPVSSPRSERVSPVLGLVGLAPVSACSCGSDLPVQSVAVPPAPAAITCGCSIPAAASAAVGPSARPTPVSCGCGSPMVVPAPAACGCEDPVPASSASTCGCANPLPIMASPILDTGSACGCGAEAPVKQPVTLRLFLSEIIDAGRRLLVMFFGFAFIGYFLNGLIPQAWVTVVFGSGNIYSVPLAATLGLPLYINSEASLPLVRALLDGGMSQGAALAFLITGAGTSIGALTGALTIARWRVIGLVVGTLWLGSIVIGYLFNLLLAAGLF